MAQRAAPSGCACPRGARRAAAPLCRAGGEGDAERLADRGGNIMSRFNWQ